MRCGGRLSMPVMDAPPRFRRPPGTSCPARSRATWSMRLALGPGGLLQLQAAEFDVEFVARLFQRASARRTAGGGVARVHHAERGDDVGQRSARSAAGARLMRRPAGAQLLGDAQHRAARARVGGGLGGVGLLRAADGAQRRARNRRPRGSRRLAGGALAWRAMNCLTMRSSSEWKLITASRPPGFRRVQRGVQAGFEVGQLAVDEDADAPGSCAWPDGSCCSPRGTTRGDQVGQLRGARAAAGLARRATMARAMRRLMRSSP